MRHIIQYFWPPPKLGGSGARKGCPPLRTSDFAKSNTLNNTSCNHSSVRVCHAYGSSILCLRVLVECVVHIAMPLCLHVFGRSRGITARCAHTRFARNTIWINILAVRITSEGCGCVRLFVVLALLGLSYFFFLTNFHQRRSTSLR